MCSSFLCEGLVSCLELPAVVNDELLDLGFLLCDFVLETALAVCILLAEVGCHLDFEKLAGFFLQNGRLRLMKLSW